MEPVLKVQWVNWYIHDTIQMMGFCLQVFILCWWYLCAFCSGIKSCGQLVLSCPLFSVCTICEHHCSDILEKYRNPETLHQWGTRKKMLKRLVYVPRNQECCLNQGVWREEQSSIKAFWSCFHLTPSWRSTWFFYMELTEYTKYGSPPRWP